jgi:hypothetical protein
LERGKKEEGRRNKKEERRKTKDERRKMKNNRSDEEANESVEESECTEVKRFIHNRRKGEGMGNGRRGGERREKRGKERRGGEVPCVTLISGLLADLLIATSFSPLYLFVNL